jgi:DnaJ-class molecular chaperone
LREAFGGGAGRRGGGRARFEPEDFGGPGADVRAEVSVSLPEAARGVTKRLRLPTGKDLDVKIPAGINEGQQVRLRGQGMTGQGGSGDVLITVHIQPHPFFSLDGNDVKLDLPITLYEAVLGGKVRAPTLDGHVELTIPPGTNSGRTFRLRGKGFPMKGGHGDLLATVRIMLPEGGDAELEALMKKWRTDKPFDPRKDM